MAPTPSTSPSASPSPCVVPVALVTGCRTGFGLVIALALARAGYKVFAGLRDPATGEALVQASSGLDVTPIALDVTVAEQRERAVADILAATGRIDLLVNNAGIGLEGPLELIEEGELRRILDVNLIGAWGMTRACIEPMRRRGGGHVIMISSMAGRIAMPLMGAYAASKFGLEAVSESWRHELRPFGIKVVLVEPGPYKTDIFKHALTGRATASPGPYAPLVERFRELQAKILTKAGDPDEVAALVVKLARQPNPTLRHPIGPTAHLRVMLRALLPARAFEAVVRRVIRSPKA